MTQNNEKSIISDPKCWAQFRSFITCSYHAGNDAQTCYPFTDTDKHYSSVPASLKHVLTTGGHHCYINMDCAYPSIEKRLAVVTIVIIQCFQLQITQIPHSVVSGGVMLTANQRHYLGVAAEMTFFIWLRVNMQENTRNIRHYPNDSSALRPHRLSGVVYFLGKSPQSSNYEPTQASDL